MKLKLVLTPILLLCSLSVFSCEKKENGNIKDWVGTYTCTSNYCEYMYRDWSGEIKCEKTEEYPKPTTDMEIKENKTWHLIDPKGPGKTGKIKCYSSYINLLDLQIDYSISPKFNFKMQYDEKMKWNYLDYRKDGSDGHTQRNFHYQIRQVRFRLINS